jgi:hypothetical protein
MHVCGDIMGLGSWEFFHGPLMKCQIQLSISFGGVGLLSMKDCAPSTFLGSWVILVSYLCYRFRIFDRSILGGYVY